MPISPTFSNRFAKNFQLFICLLLVLILPLNTTAKDENMEPAAKTVTLSGSPEAVGRIWGQINRDAIAADMQKYYFDKAAEHNISEAELIARAQDFIGITSELAPHWLTEAEAIAEAAGIDPALYISYIANVYRYLFLGDECTSYAVHKNYTMDNVVLFHKNRDNAEKAQAVFVLDYTHLGLNKYISISDASVVACMMMVNDKGLAGSADTGGLPVETPKYRGLMNTYILRYIAENAATCADALKIIQDFIEKGFYAGGGKTGTHWLFVDKEGTILEIENNSTQVKYQYHTDKVYFSVRGDAPAALALKNAAPPIDFHQFHNVSRDPSICFNSSIAGMTVEIDPQHPELLTSVWFTLPAKSIAVPIFMGQSSTPLALLNGDVYQCGKSLNGQNQLWESLEKSSYLNQQLLVSQIQALINSGQEAAARELLEKWTTNQTTGSLSILKSLQQQTKQRETKNQDIKMQIKKRYVAVDNVCAWPQLRLSDNGDIFMTGFNRPYHGLAEGDVDLWISDDQGDFFNYAATPAVHEPGENRMNHCSGFANNGDFITIVSGYSNRPPKKLYEGKEYVEKIFKKSKTLVPIIARSSDGGKTFTNVPLQIENEASIIPYGEIVKVDKTTLMCSVYLIGTKEVKSFFDGKNRKAGVLLSYDDGYTWNDFYVIDEDINETSLAVLDYKIIAAARTAIAQRVILYESLDQGKTWTRKEDISQINQIPAAITVLHDKRVLITYGCRTNQKSIMYRIGDANAENFSAPNILQVIETDGDMGYPSTVQLADGSLVTAYYTSRDTQHHRYHVGIIHWEL